MGNHEQIARECRDRGRQCFRNSDYQGALKEYSRAIKHCPNDAAYYTNRALCQQKIEGHWQAAREDCLQCIKLDPKNVKAHYFLAKADMEVGEHNKAIINFAKALEFAAERAQTKELRDELYDALYVAKKRKFLAEEAQRFQQLQELKDQCKALLEAEMQRKREAHGSAAQDGDLQQQFHGYACQLSLLESLFLQETQKIRSREVPECFCCKISMDIMKDPVVTPAGHSYDRRYLQQHLVKVGGFEPTTREPMTEKQIAPNYNLRAAIQDFLENNPWAYPG